MLMIYTSYTTLNKPFLVEVSPNKANRGKLKWEIRGLNDGGTAPDTFGSHSGVIGGRVRLCSSEDDP